MVKKINNNGISGKTIVEIGAGVAALSVAAYVLFGKEGKKNRKVIRGWAVKMKGEIIEKIENAKEITEPAYREIIDNMQAKYAKLKNVDQAELVNTITELKKHWKAIKKEAMDKKPKAKTSKKK
jgi:hypothetical protein